MKVIFYLYCLLLCLIPPHEGSSEAVHHCESRALGGEVLQTDDMGGDIERVILDFPSVAVTSTMTKAPWGKQRFLMEYSSQFIPGESQDKDSRRNLKQIQWSMNQF